MTDDLLYAPGSLTHLLRARAQGMLSVQLISAQWEQPHPQEAILLGLPTGEAAWIRQVALSCNQHLWTLGRTVIPKATVVHTGGCFTELGNTSIGDILFKDPETKRGEITVFQIHSTHPYYTLLPISLRHASTTLWGRHSLLHFQKNTLLVVDVFSPEVLMHAD